MYIFTIENGGFFESIINYFNLVIGYGKINKILLKKSLLFSEYKDARDILDKYIFHFIKYLEIRNKNFNNFENIINLYPEYVVEIPEIRVSSNANSDDIEQCMKASFNYDLVFAKKILDKLNLKNEFFTIDYLEKNYPDGFIDVVEQNPNFTGFTFNW